MDEFDLSTPVRVLERAECETLLHAADTGRVAFANGQFPMILPVNFVMADDLVVFRTGVGTKLANIPMQPVAFEIDGRTTDGAWSVVVVGHAREVTTALGPRYDALRASHLETVAPGPKMYWIAIEIESISGRAFRAASR